MQLMIDGIPVTVTRKKIKHLYLTLSPADGAVRLSVPYGVSDAAVRDFVRSRRHWIERQQTRLPDLSAQPADGQTAALWGRLYTLRFAAGCDCGLHGDTLLLAAPPDSSAQQREAALHAFWKTALHAEISRRLPVWEGITVLYCAGWQIRNMKTRWGSCTPGSKKLRFSLLLACRPIECLDYVILHELAHLQVPNHGQDFYSLLDRYMPDWRARRALLNGRRSSAGS